jgi:hypothetical protein
VREWNKFFLRERAILYLTSMGRVCLGEGGRELESCGVGGSGKDGYVERGKWAIGE